MSELGRRRPHPREAAIVIPDPLGPQHGIEGLRTPGDGAAIVSAVREGAWRTPRQDVTRAPRVLANEPSDGRMPRGGEAAIVLDNSVDFGDRIPGLAEIPGDVIIAAVQERAWETTPEPIPSEKSTTVFEN